MKKLITILILTYAITAPSYAYEKEIEPEIIFAHKQRSNTKQEILIQAIKKISQRATYQKGKFNPSDVLTGQVNCQGYSLMLYLMLTKSNIDCKVVYNETHMWNMVKLSDTWQQIDLTAMDRYLYVKY